jgi:hypothetical protein
MESAEEAVCVTPIKYITESEAKVLMNEVILEWERRVGSKRHEENAEKFDRIFEILNKMKGAMWAVGGAMTAIFTIFKLIDTLRH